jgi:hypothetical protein
MSAPSPRRSRAPRPRRPAAGRPAPPAWLAPALIAVAALAVRSWALRHQPWVTIDGTEYIRFSEALAAGRPFPSVFPPGYPALIALARLVVADRVVAAALVSVLAGALLTVPVWALARRAVGPRWAIAPALVVAIHPHLVQYSAITMSESAYFLALYAGLALAAGGRAGGAGLAIGAGFAIRPEALGPAALLAVREGLRAVRRVVPARPLALAAGFLVLAVPCWLSFRATLGTWTLTPKLGAFREAGATWQAEEIRFLGIAPAAPAPPPEPPGRRVGDAVRHAPARALTHARSLLLVWPAPLLLLSLLGLARRRGLETFALAHLVVIPFLALSGQPRFVLGAVPALAVLASAPIALARGRRGALALGALGIAGALWCGIANHRELTLPVESYGEAHREAGAWLAGVAAAGEPVMDRKPHLAFYAGLPYRVMPEAPYDSLLDHAVASGARYLVLDEAVVRVFRPQLRPLIYDPAFRARERRVELVYAGGHFAGYGLMVFRVQRPGESPTGAPPRFDVRWRTPDGSLPPGTRAP